MNELSKEDALKIAEGIRKVGISFYEYNLDPRDTKLKKVEETNGELEKILSSMGAPSDITGEVRDQLINNDIYFITGTIDYEGTQVRTFYLAEITEKGEGKNIFGKPFSWYYASPKTPDFEGLDFFQRYGPNSDDSLASVVIGNDCIVNIDDYLYEFSGIYNEKESILKKGEEADNKSYEGLADKMLARFVSDMIEGCEEDMNRFISNCVGDYLDGNVLYFLSTQAGSDNLASEDEVRECKVGYLHQLSQAPSYYLLYDMFNNIANSPDNAYGYASKLVFSEFEKKGFSSDRFLTADKKEISKIAGELLEKYIA